MRYSSSFIIALVVFLMANVLLGKFSRAPFCVANLDKSFFRPHSASHSNGIDQTWSWWLSKAFVEQGKAPDIVLFGSSQMASAVATTDAQSLFRVIDTVTHKRAMALEKEFEKRLGITVTIFNSALPGSMASDVYIISRAMFKDQFKPKLVIVGISPRDFIDNAMPCPAATEPFKFFSRFVDIKEVAAIAFSDVGSLLAWKVNELPLRKLGLMYITTRIASRHFPQQDTTNTYRDKALEAAIASASLPKPGEWLVPANIPPIWVDNTKEYKHRFRNTNPTIYKAELEFFDKFLARMQAAEVKCLVVAMPSLSMNRALLPAAFWKNFRGTIAGMCRQHGALWLDISDSAKFIKSDYLDTVHLNAHGGAKLFPLIADNVMLSSELNLCLMDGHNLNARKKLAKSGLLYGKPLY